MTAVQATYVIECDWNADGDYSDTSEDITGDVLEFTTKRGRDFASQLTGRASAGTFTARLDNTSQKYSSFNASSPIYGLILPGRRVRVRTTAPTAATLWTGFLDSIQPESAPGGALFATLTARGAFTTLQGAKVHYGPVSGDATGQYVDGMLTIALWAGGRIIDTGLTSPTVFFADEDNLLEMLRQMEDTEFGFLYEGIDHDVVFEQRTHRLTGAHLTSQATFSDAAAAARPYVAIQQADPLQDIYNVATAVVHSWTAGSLSVLWTSNDPSLPVTIAPGESRSWIATYSGSGYVSAWTEPVLGTDIIKSGVADGSVSVVVTKRAQRMVITITNNHATDTLTVSSLQARGVPNSENDKVEVTASDSASRTAYGLRSYPLPAEWLPNSLVAQDYCSYAVSRYKDPHPIVAITVAANRDSTMMTEALTRAISDRVTIVANGNAGLGISGDFYIESISHSVSQGKMLHMTTFELSPASADAAYWILGTSALGTDTTLGY